MAKKLINQKTRQLLKILGLLLLLPLVVWAALQIQELRKRAAGTNEVEVKFSPSTGTFTQGQQLTVKVVMSKVAQRAINVSGAQAVFTVSDKFAIDSANCEAPFDGLPFTRINGQTVTVMCAIGTTATPVAVTSNLPFASINLTVQGAATDGQATIDYSSTRATEAGVSGQAPDVSTGGTSASFNISSTSGLTPTPTAGLEPTPTTPFLRDVNLSFVPAQAVLPPDTKLTIMMDSGVNKIGFARVVFIFDPSKIQLTTEITTTPALSTKVQITDKNTANSSGQAIIVIAASPTDTQPSGNFEFASFTVRAISTIPNDSTIIDFTTSDMQIVEGSGINLTIGTSLANITINGDIVTPPIGQEFEVPIGTKDSLTINIMEGPTPTGVQPTTVPGHIPQITFSAVLAHTQNNPEMYFKLRVKDELFFLDNPNALPQAACNTAGAGEKDFYIPMQSLGGIYKPVPSINVPAPNGVTIAAVTTDGWVVLNGVNANRYYSLILKAPKFRGTLMAEHVFLQGGQRNEQVFSWINNPLEPGDLPNPNLGMLQDCTVNAIDISLIVSRIGTTDQANLDVADVNFDDIVNGNDVAKVVNTLSTKPDDDL